MGYEGEGARGEGEDLDGQTDFLGSIIVDVSGAEWPTDCVGDVGQNQREQEAKRGRD